MSETPMPHAEALGKFRKELIDNGIPNHLADDLVREAARSLLDSGLIVKAAAE
jgi:hypothetical protein